MSLYNYLLSELSIEGLDKYVFYDFDKAKSSGQENSLVIIPDGEENKFDIYLTGFYNGEFGEWACFVEQEFDDENDLFDNVLLAIKNIYRHEEAEEKRIQLEGVYNLYFNAY